MEVNVTLDTMSSNYTNISTVPTGTTMTSSGIPNSSLIIIIASLGGTAVVLVLILAIIFCRRKSQKSNFASVEEVSNERGGHRNLSFTTTTSDELQENDDPIYRPTPNIEADKESEVKDSVYSEVLPKERLPSTQSQNSDYENAEAIAHINSTAKDLAPPPLHKRGGGPITTNLFRQGTKAYHLYRNALQDYEIDPKSLSMIAKIGKGNFSTVYSGMATSLPYTDATNQLVAIKTMKSSASDSDKQEFLYEFEIMKLTNTLQHKNITKLLASVTTSYPCMLVLELMPNDNLRNFLRATRSQDIYYNLHSNSNSLSERQLLQFGIDIASGMEGLADLQLLHRDLAARNVLLDSNLTCKIADFGFAKDILNKPEYRSKSILHRARPVRWLAPESLFYFKHSIMSDVWSYGIVLWEIVSLGNLPYPGMNVKEVNILLKLVYY